MKITAFGDCLELGIYHFHSGFENIDNFANQYGEFISIAADHSFIAPNTIIITDFFSGKYSQIIIEKGAAFIDNQKYLLNNEFQYSSFFNYPEIAFTTIEKNISAFINIYKSFFPDKSLFFLLHPENKQNFTSAFDNAFIRQIEFAFSIFKNHFYESIHEFKSRGGGLTPSGDDFIAGVLFGIDYFESIDKKSYTKIKHTIFEISKSNNIFSNNMLRLADHAKYFKRLKDFLYAFYYLTLDEVKPAFKQLISVGDTSGADLLTGFFTVLLNRPDILNE